MLVKKAKYILSEFAVLNQPDLSNSVFKDCSIEVDAESVQQISKFAKKEHKEDDIQNGADFDLEHEVKQNPDALFVKCFAIPADEVNDNGDYFSELELKKAVSTFVGVPVYTNHNNTDIEQSRGKVVYSWWDDQKKGIMVIMRIDATAYPHLARGIQRKYMMSTSMGASVKYSVCSACHNCAEVPTNYCNCIKERKTRHVSAKKQKCRYHEHGTEKECPLCGSTKDNLKIFDYDGKAFEHNYGVKFIENSVVGQPAFHDCGITEIIDTEKFLKKVADIRDRLPLLLKAASQHNILCTDRQCVKLAGQQEINDLNTALDLITNVSKSILAQKQQIDLEFLSDLVKVLADLQTVTDELSQQGYGRLPSPGDENTQPQSQLTPGTGQITHSVGGKTSPTQTVPGPAPTPGTSGRIQSGSAGEVGKVTMPTMSIGKRIHLEKIAKYIHQYNHMNFDIALDRTPERTIDFQLSLKKPKKILEK